jgi:hypothetical protein
LRDTLPRNPGVIPNIWKLLPDTLAFPPTKVLLWPERDNKALLQKENKEIKNPTVTKHTEAELLQPVPSKMQFWTEGVYFGRRDGVSFGRRKLEPYALLQCSLLIKLIPPPI